MTAPDALLLVDADEPVDPLDDPVPVAEAAFVTVPVPAVPAWLRRLEQVLLVEPVLVLAFPLKSHAVEALFCLR